MLLYGTSQSIHVTKLFDASPLKKTIDPPSINGVLCVIAEHINFISGTVLQQKFALFKTEIQ